MSKASAGSHVGTIGETTLPRMAEPAARSPAGDDAPPFDPVAIDRAYLQERARRRARIERSRARRRAALRFWLVLLALIAVSVLLILTIWREAGSTVSGGAVESGHYPAEEAPDVVLEAFERFFV